ncbi:MAG: hypothetical protein VB957_01805 [Pseudomonadales bacterium]|jgi:hypothetical protein
MELIWDDLTPNELKAAQYQAMQTFYWEKKDLPNYLLVAKAVLELLLEYAKKNVELRGEYADVAIQTSYNIASMTWAGWDEEGISLDEAQKLIGLQAAELNVRLATEFNLPPKRRQNGLWMLAAQQLAGNNPAAAKETFMEQLSVIQNADLGMDATPKAWIAACNLIDGTGTIAEHDATLEQLASDEEGEQQAGFLRTAMAIFLQDSKPA